MEDAFGDPPSDGLLVSAEHGGGTSPIDARPGDDDRLAEVANEGAGEDDVVFEALLDSARWVDDAAIVVHAGVRSAEAKAPGARWAREDRHETAARAMKGFETVAANLGR